MRLTFNGVLDVNARTQYINRWNSNIIIFIFRRIAKLENRPDEVILYSLHASAIFFKPDRVSIKNEGKKCCLVEQNQSRNVEAPFVAT